MDFVKESFHCYEADEVVMMVSLYGGLVDGVCRMNVNMKIMNSGWKFCSTDLWMIILIFDVLNFGGALNVHFEF